MKRCCNFRVPLPRVGLWWTLFLPVCCYYLVIHQNEISEGSTVRYLPAWFPGAGFKRTAVHWAQTLTDMVEGPHQYVKQQMVSCLYLTGIKIFIPPCRCQEPRNHPLLPACLKSLISLLQMNMRLNGLLIRCMQVAQIQQVLYTKFKLKISLISHE